MSSDHPFLTLSAEIRLRIYSYCTPINAPIPSYAGLFLSCKQINTEYPIEALKTLNKFINRIEQSPEAQAQGVKVTHPTRFHDRPHDRFFNSFNGIGTLRIHLNVPRGNPKFAISVLFLPLLSLHLAVLSIELRPTTTFHLLMEPHIEIAGPGVWTISSGRPLSRWNHSLRVVITIRQ